MIEEMIEKYGVKIPKFLGKYSHPKMAEILQANMEFINWIGWLECKQDGKWVEAKYPIARMVVKICEITGWKWLPGIASAVGKYLLIVTPEPNAVIKEERAKQNK